MFNYLIEALNWVENQENPIPRPAGDEKLSLAFEYLGNPHKDLSNIIHVTGTNGKGSTVAFLEKLLRSQGYNVGTFTGPHIMYFNERFKYNGEFISDQLLLEIINTMVDLNKYMQTTEYGKLVFFELFTVMMVLFFKEVEPDIIICEVGIGGFNDATHILDTDVQIITTVGIDHEDLMGNSIESVAIEKAGIIKPNSLVMLGNVPDTAREIFSKRARRLGCDIAVYDHNFYYAEPDNLGPDGSRFKYYDSIHCGDIHSEELMENYEGLTFQTRMVGEHQIQNASLALATFFRLMDKDPDKEVNEVAAANALLETKWDGRMERIRTEAPMIYIDGAHNPAGLSALKSMLEQFFPDKDITLLYTGIDTKDQKTQIKQLLDLNLSKLVFTEFDNSKAVSLNIFQEYYKDALDEKNIFSEDQETSVEFVDNWQQYIKYFIEKEKDNTDSLLLITGSLYFISQVRQFMTY